ncbi:hypothetical protein OTU49_005839 [Cherax quadricarinatus]|uniref:Homeobox domain-containing protein n=1 Tax=Cherax quadricarinatus TaxID=27406 RepID=A0AAW0WQH6_CHEQU|nr:uncharacterized protein LOC128695478 [Cherax quadricarinatus]XP_053642119.1 uncharacterized protein LOC128695478 [Cherax quadricarinatus]XP_053642120.1 uncharacterized protein LOC128695478 [Cherax quadricarinatus]XP_053642121.1 uncharacterized protein LOC128695478 [Cherax quadricarinatus]
MSSGQEGNTEDHKKVHHLPSDRSNCCHYSNMLTQHELLNATDGFGDEDSSMSVVSPLDGLAEYPMEQAEFEYFETSLPNDSFYDVPHPQELHQTLPPPPAGTPTSAFTTPVYDPSSYDSTIIYDQDDMAPFTSQVAAFNDDLKSPQEITPYEEEINTGEDELKFSEDMGYDGFSGSLYESNIGAADTQTDTLGFDSLCSAFDNNPHVSVMDESTPNMTWEEGSGKGKIGPLQRRALDSIFSVTDKPSRGLVLHIASELGLHHLTVKNFFSNGRRRLRRAAARLNDPERSRRENERRKEKRRLAALSSTLSVGEGKMASVVTSSSRVTSPQMPPADSPLPKETPVVSPERRALMEKLADKVQRSVAQRSLAADLDLLRSSSSQTLLAHNSHVFLSHSSHDLLTQPSNDILSQASHDILTQSTHDLLTPSPHNFLTQPPQKLCTDHTSTPPSLLQSHTDPWNLF